MEGKEGKGGTGRHPLQLRRARDPKLSLPPSLPPLPPSSLPPDQPRPPLARCPFALLRPGITTGLGRGGGASLVSTSDNPCVRRGRAGGRGKDYHTPQPYLSSGDCLGL
jgi:hypothetical protein